MDDKLNTSLMLINKNTHSVDYNTGSSYFVWILGSLKDAFKKSFIDILGGFRLILITHTFFYLHAKGETNCIVVKLLW